MAFSMSAFGLAENEVPPGWAADRFDTLTLLNPEQISDGYPHSEIEYLDIANVRAGVIEKPASISLTDAPSRAKRIVRINDSILSTVRPGNRAYAFLREIPDNLIVSTGFVVIRAKANVADPRYVYYIATSDPLIDYLASIAEEKTAYPSVNPGDIAECIVPIPSLPEQRAIAHILGTLDDKIELNRRMNETLEEMARAIFKSWFVDFDPVRAKAEGWEDGKVDNMASIGREAVNPSEHPDEHFDHYSIPAFDEGKLPKIELGNSIQSNKFTVPSNAVLLSKLNPRFPRVWLPKISGSRRSICSTEFLVSIPKQSISREYLFGLFSSQSFLEVFTTLVTGTSSSHQRVKPEYLLAMDITIPSKEIIEHFTKLVRPLHEKAAHNIEESHALAALRDALLPKLISGEIRVKDAERFMEKES